ncbi:MAG: hypothetical protein K0R09_2032 [Clostridiales bacterium]|jgi:hypothetical protein|nr:hypothetical protein [Clostridiales bacterium]
MRNIVKKENAKIIETDTKHNFALYFPVIKLNNWEDKDGRIVLCIKTNDPLKKFLAWMVKKSPVTRLELDDRSSTVWKHMDGSSTVYDIARYMSETYKEDVNDELYRLVTYLKYIAKRGWIIFKQYDITSSKT